MRKVERFEDLNVWKSAVQIASDIFKICATDKLRKDFSTKDQGQRAALSVSNNIAEGFEHDNPANFIRFLRYAKGSTNELRNQLFVLKQIDYVTDEFYEDKYVELILLSKQLASFIKYLKEFKGTNNS